MALALLADAVTLHWRTGHEWSAPTTGRDARLLAWLLLAVVAVVVVLGTVATGSGPDAGSADVARFGFRFQAAVELHSVVAMFLVGLTVAMFFVLRADAVAPTVMRAYEVLLVATVLQGVVGYSQYFSGLPTGLIEVHVLGAGVLVIASLRFTLAVGSRPVRRWQSPSG